MDIQEPQDIAESVVSQVIQELKEYLDTPEFRASLERAASQVIPVKAEFRVTREYLGFLDIRVFLGYPVTLERRD